MPRKGAGAGLEATQVTLGLAFLAGLLSLISPCVLALIPVYVTYMSGVSVRGAASAGGPRFNSPVLAHALLFIAGFTVLFVLYGASASLLGRLLITNQQLLGKIAGVLVAAFGLHLLGVLHIPWLERERRWQYQGSGGRYHHSLLIGMAFAAGWTPCVGPILGAILALASVHATLWDGVSLLLTYAAGMALPFLGLAAALDRSQGLLAALKRHYRTIEVTSGLLLIAIGAMLYTDTFSTLARYFNYLGAL